MYSIIEIVFRSVKYEWQLVYCLINMIKMGIRIVVFVIMLRNVNVIVDEYSFFLYFEDVYIYFDMIVWI